MKKIILLSFTIITLAVGLNAQTIIKLGENTRIVNTSDKQSHAFTGYFNITDMGLMIGSPVNSRVAPFSFMTINGVHITDQLSAGLGIGVEFPAGSYMPIVFDTRYYIRNTSFSPFLNFYGGYALLLDDNSSYYTSGYWLTDYYQQYHGNEQYSAKGGLILNPGFGIRNMFGENFGVIFAIGYRFQRLYYFADNGGRLFTDFNRLTMKIGIIFR